MSQRQTFLTACPTSWRETVGIHMVDYEEITSCYPTHKPVCSP